MTEQKEEVVNIRVDKRNFELNVVKLISGKVYVEGSVKMIVNADDEPNLKEITKTIKETVENIPHPDLTEAIYSMKPFLLDQWNFLFPIVTIEEFVTMKDIEKGLKVNEQKIITELNVFMQDKLQKMSEKITISGASVSGKAKGIIITGKNKPEDKQISMNMPRRNFEKDPEGNEGELKVIWNTIESEVFNLLYKGKQSQLSAFESKHPEEDEKGLFDGEKVDGETKDATDSE